MTDQTVDVLIRLKRMDDAQIRPVGGPFQRIEKGPRLKLSLSFGPRRESEVKADA